MWKIVNIPGNHEIATGNAICRWDVVTKSVYIVNSQVLLVFLNVSDFCTSFPNIVDHSSAYLWPTSFERSGHVVWKSWLFPCVQSSFRARCWVLMKPLQWSCVKLKLRTWLAARTAYLKLRPWHPASVEGYPAWDRFVQLTFEAYAWVLLHCGSPAKPRLLLTAVPHAVAVVRMGSPGTWTAHNTNNSGTCVRWGRWPHP